MTLTPERRRQIEAFIAGLPLNNQNPYRAWPNIAEELLNEIDRLAGQLTAVATTRRGG